MRDLLSVEWRTLGRLACLLRSAGQPVKLLQRRKLRTASRDALGYFSRIRND